MTESALLFSESYLSKARFARAQNTKLDNSSSFRNHSTSKAFRSFLNGTVQKNESTIPSDSVSYVEEKNYRSLRTEAFRILNDSKDLASIDKSSFLGGERNTSVTPINNAITENNDTRTSLDVGERVIFKRTNNANRPQTGLFLLTANGQNRGKTGSPTPKPVVKKKKVEVEGQRTRNASQKDKGLKDFKFIYGRQSPARKSEVSLTMKRHLIEAKSKDASVSIAKGIDYDQKKIDAKLHLGDSLDLSNGSESPVNAKNYRRNMTCETEGDEKKKKKTPIHEIYTDLIKKHLKEEAGTTWKRTPLAGRKLLNNRPQTCKNSFTSPKDFRNLVSTKNETPTTLHKLSDTTLHIHTDLKPANPLHRVTSVGAMAPKINLDASEIAIIDQKATKADMLKRPTTASPHNQKSPSISSIPQRTMKDGLHSVTNFKFERVLGQGAYAVVKLAWDKIRGQKVAVKIYDKSMLADPRKMKNVRREISILKQMDHPNVIKLLDSFETPRQIYVVMEFVGKSSLHSFLRSLGPRKLEEIEVKRIFSQLCQSISYCHRKNIVHRDIKLENILMDDQDNIKIIDFGFSICIGHDKKLNFFCGTPSYMAPEIVSKTLYKGAATDVWALGVILYILLCGHFPFRGNDDRELFYRIQKGKLEFPAHVPHDAKTFIQKLLKVNPDERLKIDEVLQDKWLSG